ncbi:MAG: PIN domain-containing protein [Alphaproteobacteria bacterium]|nr:PIN domain-containing protein [Alphaproteobacteria bacterium]
MIILDTNVLSEVMRPEPDEAVANWLTAQHPASLFVTTISQAEILYGVALLPAGRRRDALDVEARAIFDVEFADRVLPLDRSAASAYATVVTARRTKGRPISPFDAQIAAITASRGAMLATRNVKDFEDCGISVLDPWSAG